MVGCDLQSGEEECAMVTADAVLARSRKSEAGVRVNMMMFRKQMVVWSKEWDCN